MIARTRWMVLGVAALAAGCASIASGTTQNISVSSNVEGAEVFLDGVRIGVTPFTGGVDKNKDQLRLEADGYSTETVALSKSLDPVFWGNIIIGGTLGSLTDFATGAAYQYAPAAYQVDLRPEEQPEDEFLAEVATRKFSMVYIDNIGQDVARGEGEYLDALVQIAGMESTRPVTHELVENAFLRSNGDPVRFGEAVVALR